MGKSVVKRETSMLPVVDFSRETQWLEKGTVVGSIEIAGEVDESQLNDVGEIPSKEAGELNFDSRISNNLSRKQRKQVRKLLKRFTPYFATSNSDLLWYCNGMSSCSIS